MSYAVLATPEFERDYRKLPAEVARRLNEKIDFLANHPEEMRHPLQYLPESLKGLHKYRVGDYRLLFWPDHPRKTMILYAVAHRREAYRRLRSK